MKLSIIIPAHNEEYRLPPVLKAYAAYFSNTLENDFEILVIVNGSNDRTATVARDIGGEYPQVRVIEKLESIGKGGAVIAGVKMAKGDWVGFVDADGATAEKEFDRLYRCAQHADGVIASRWIKGSQVNVSQRGLRLLSSRLFNGLIRLVLGLNYKDTQCGAKLFTAKAWRTILPQIGTTRFAFDVDLLFQLKRHGFNVLEEPTAWNDVEGSKVQVFNTSVEMFLAVIRMRLVNSSLQFTVGWYDRLLARPVDFLLSDRLFRHAMLLFSASMAIAVFNVGYQMVIGRVLPERDYALLATFLALFAILGRPLGTLTTALSRYTSLLVSEDREADVRRLLGKWMMLLGSASLLIAVVCVFFVESIATHFHLNRVAPILVSILAIPVLFIAPVLAGTLQGLQRFGWVSIGSIIGAGGRLLLGVVFVLMLYPACGWALAGHVGGLYLSLGISFVALMPLLFKKRGANKRRPLPSLRFYLLQCFVFQLAAGVLLTGDVIFVNHYLPEETNFAYAATLGRIVAFMAMSVAAAMFPKVVSEGTFSDEHRRLYQRSQLYTSFFIFLSLMICLLIPHFLLKVLFHIEYPSADLLAFTRWMSISMALATLLNINLNLLLAQRRFLLLMSVLGCALFYVVMVHFYHETPYQIIVLSLVTNLVALVITTLGILRPRPKPKSVIA